MYTSEKTTPLPSDDELLTRYRTDGRTEHLAELYTRYTELVYGMACTTCVTVPMPRMLSCSSSRS